MEHLACPEEFDELTVSGTPRTRLEEIAGWTGKPGDASAGSVHIMIWGYVGGLLLWLLLPTLNLVSLNMSRIIERSGEIGVRKAFGASAASLVGQFILENVILCLIGGLLSLFGALAVLRLVENSGLVPFSHIDFNYRIFLYAVALACFFGILSGLLPAWRMSRLHPVQALRGGAR
jgi:putative ABC transport system permease protein